MVEKKLYGIDDEMDFGKYDGWIIQDLLDEDPGYMRWLTESVERVSFTQEVEDMIP